MPFRALFPALPILALAASLTGVILSANSPVLSDPWHVPTSWSELLVSPQAQVIWLVLAAAGLMGAVLSRRMLLVPFCIPAALLAFWAPPSLTMDTSLLSRQVALTVMQDAILSGETPDQPAFPEFGTGLRHKLADAVFETGGLESFEANEIPTSYPKAEASIARANEALRVSREQLAELKSRLTEIRLQDCRIQLPQFFFGVVEEVVIDALPSRAKRALRGCEDRQRTHIADTERGIVIKTQEIAAQEAGIAEANRVLDAENETLVTLSAARASAIAAAGWQRETAAQTALIVIAASMVSIFAVLFTQWGGRVLVGSSLLVIAGVIGAPLWPLPNPAHLFVLASALSVFAVLIPLLAFRYFVRHNAELWRVLQPGERLRTLLLTPLYWAFPAALLLVGLLLSKAIDDWSMDQFYRTEASTGENGNDCDPKGRLLATARGSDGTCLRRRLEADVERAIRSHFEVARERARSSVETLTDESVSTVAQVTASAGQIVDAMLPDELAQSRCSAPDCTSVSPAFNVQTGCDVWRVVCHLKNEAKHAARRVYDDARKDTVNAVAEKLSQANAAAEGNAARLKEDAGQGIDEITRASILRLDQISWAWFRAGDVVKAISIFCLSLAALKSLGYVLIRVIHNQPGFNDRLSAAYDAKPQADGDQDAKLLMSEDGSLSLPAGGTYCIASSVAVQGHQSHLVFPIPSLILFIRRTLAGIGNRKNANAWYSYFKTGPESGEFTISTDQGRRLVAIPLEEGEEIAFDPSTFVGRSNTVRLKMHWSFRATDLMAGRIRRPHAHGPGYAIFRTAGKIEIARGGAGHEADQLVEVSRLVAWTPGIPYRLASHKGFGAMYLGTTDVAPAASGIALGDGGRGARVAFGAVRSFLLLLPI